MPVPSPVPQTASVAACLIADRGTFVSRPVPVLDLDFSGIVGDYHAGTIRKSTSREPWYPRGTVIRNDRQLTIVSEAELSEVAAAMSLPSLDPAWIGANLLLRGITGLTQLPIGTRMFFAGGASLLVEGENAPCRVAGQSIGEHAGRDGFDLLFPKLARHKRGVVASVEKPGRVAAGDAVTVRMPRTPA
jgi:hypothetical protein